MVYDKCVSEGPISLYEPSLIFVETDRMGDPFIEDPVEESLRSGSYRDRAPVIRVLPVALLWH